MQKIFLILTLTLIVLVKPADQIKIELESENKEDKEVFDRKLANDPSEKHGLIPVLQQKVSDYLIDEQALLDFLTYTIEFSPIDPRFEITIPIYLFSSFERLRSVVPGYDNETLDIIKKLNHDNVYGVAISKNRQVLAIISADKKTAKLLILKNDLLKSLNFQQLKLLHEFALAKKYNKNQFRLQNLKLKLNNEDQKIFNSLPELIRLCVGQNFEIAHEEQMPARNQEKINPTKCLNCVIL